MEILICMRSSRLDRHLDLIFLACRHDPVEKNLIIFPQLICGHIFISWTYEDVMKRKQEVEASGLGLIGIESINVHEDIKIGLPTRDELPGGLAPSPA